MRHRALISCALFLLLAIPSLAEVDDGKLFDPGVHLSAPAENAPEALSRMAGFVGEWDVKMEVHRPGQEVLHSEGVAKVTFANRGHSLLERTRVADFDGQGHEMSTIAFLAVNGAGVWTAAEGNSWTESISVASGGFEGMRLVLHGSLRPGGGAVHLLLRHTYVAVGEAGFEHTLEISSDLGAVWNPAMIRRYQRREPSEAFFPVRDDYGAPAPDRPAEAGQFDFLVGEFDAKHWLQRPQQPALRYQDNATAVYVLHGKAILEFNWNDLDTTFPDAATSILRLYNRSMRRWENLYLTNRTNTPLHFGGVREGERIVLHPFDSQTGGNPLFQWIFYDQRENAYRWKGLRSDDRGATWKLTWGIDFVRKGTAMTASEGLIPPTEITATSGDGVWIFGDLYRPSGPNAKTVLLFHQAGGDARGELGDIARRLQREGFEVFAWDVRGGGDRFGSSNRTVAALQGAPPEGYCVAYPDLEAALSYAEAEGSGGSMYALGSSYSAALVIRLGAEHGNALAGVASFSPASGRMEECEVGAWLPRLGEVPLMVFRPRSEMEVESVAAQTQRFGQQGVEVFIAEEASHGASMLHPERSKEVEATWERLLRFFADPTESGGEL